MDEIIIENVEGTQQESTANKGNVKISTEVVATIAGIAANEINGVSGMCGNIAGGIAELLGNKKNPSKGVKVEITEEGLDDLQINDSIILKIFFAMVVALNITE